MKKDDFVLLETFEMVDGEGGRTEGQHEDVYQDAGGDHDDVDHPEDEEGNEDDENDSVEDHDDVQEAEQVFGVMSLNAPMLTYPKEENVDKRWTLYTLLGLWVVVALLLWRAVSEVTHLRGEMNQMRQELTAMQQRHARDFNLSNNANPMIEVVDVKEKINQHTQYEDMDLWWQKPSRSVDAMFDLDEDFAEDVGDYVTDLLYLFEEGNVMEANLFIQVEVFANNRQQGHGATCKCLE